MSNDLERQIQKLKTENEELRQALEQKTAVANRAVANFQQRALHMEIIRQQNQEMDRLTSELTRAKQVAEEQVTTEQVLREVTAAINSREDVIAALPDISRHLSEVIPVDVVTLAAYTPGRPDYLLYAVGTEAQTAHFAQRGLHLPLENTCPGWVIRHDDLWLDDDMQVKKTFMEDEQLLSEGLISRLVLPLRLRGQVIGTLNMSSRQPQAFKEADLSLLWQVTEQVVLALERTLLLEDARRRIHIEQTIREITEKMQAATSLADLVRITAEALNTKFSMDYTLIDLGIEPVSAPSSQANNGHQA